MAQQTLQKKYQFRQLTENVKRAERQLMLENNHAQLLIEVMDEQDLQKASAIIDKLRNVKGKGIQSLDTAIDNAETQLNKYTGGGPLVKGWAKLKGIVGFDNPLVKFMTFANALETGFKQLPTILKNTLGGADLQANQDKTISQIITDPAKQKIITDNMLKALSPKGFFSAFKKVPYVDKQALVQNLINVPIKNLSLVLNQINSGPDSTQIGADIKSTAMQGQDVANKGTQQAAPAQSTTGTTSPSPSHAADKTSPTAAAGETPDRQPSDVIDKVYKQLSTSLVDAAGSERRARAVLKLLNDEGKLKA